MTRSRIGLLMGLFGLGLCGACGSSSALSIETDGGATADTSPSSGTAQTGGGGGTSGGTPSTEGMGGAGGSESESSASGGRIKSGTVAMSATSGATTSSCQQLTLLMNPSQPMTGYLGRSPIEYQKDGRAGEPSYVFLDGGKDAVILPGPDVSYGTGSVNASTAKLTTCVNYEAACQGQDGYLVQVNDRLSFAISIDDWEDEIALGTVYLCLNSGNLSTQFVFAGLSACGGVAHDVTITPILDNAQGTPTTPITIECRR